MHSTRVDAKSLLLSVYSRCYSSRNHGAPADRGWQTQTDIAVGFVSQPRITAKSELAAQSLAHYRCY
jgi:hypothetical protein